MADLAYTRILWMRKRHPVDIPGGVRGKLDCLVEITNGGSPPGGATWTSPTYHIRGHLQLADGRYIQDPAMEAIDLPSSIAMGATFQHQVTFLSEPLTPGVTSAQLFDPDTLIVVDVVNEGVAWLGGTPPGYVGQMYIRDGLRDQNSDGDFLQASTRRHMRDQAFNVSAVPTSGLEQDVIFFQIPSDRTVYLENLEVTATGGDETVHIYLKREGSPEIFFRRVRVPQTQSYFASLNLLRLDQGDWIRVAVQPNPNEDPGGEISVHVNFVSFPWEET